MPPKSKATTPRLRAAEPQLFVSNLTVSNDFYREKLGFSVAFTYGEPPFYSQITRGGAKLNLRCVSIPVIDPARREKEDLLSASITLDNVSQLYLEFQASGVTFHQPLRKEPWGARTFVVRDPDGNLILFAADES